jgi:hypothetical protein
MGMMLTITGIPDVPAASSVRPAAVVTSAGWSAVGGPDLVSVVGDGSDTSYAQSPTLTASVTTLRYSLASMVSSPGGVNVRVRCGLDVSVTTTTTVKLYVGTGTSRLVKSGTIAPDSVADLVLAVSAADITAASVTGTDWNNLQVEINSNI